ncbi:three-helix bundle dimerization domain-containing protein [Agromyces seonyuensis]|uniref:three-helix bundle dimerization domain-containing protein n=1 Tax=Agromyces seonyuensis TaxID=2662446 RepID=UPI001922AF35|nr:hypothetical protein [Agromyces seonyuensis]
MGDPVERNAIANVIERLVERFPTLTRERVEAVVGEEAERLADGRVREYIPALVEHAADERLRLEGEPLPVVDDSEAPAVVQDDGDSLDPSEVERRQREQHAGFLFGDLGGGPS